MEFISFHQFIMADAVRPATLKETKQVKDYDDASVESEKREKKPK